MPEHKIVSPDDWTAARIELLRQEKEFTRQRDQLAQKRRELPWSGHQDPTSNFRQNNLHRRKESRMKSWKYIIVIFVVLSVVLSACGPKTPETIEECIEALRGEDEEERLLAVQVLSEMDFDSDGDRVDATYALFGALEGTSSIDWMIPEGIHERHGPTAKHRGEVVPLHVVEEHHPAPLPSKAPDLPKPHGAHHLDELRVPGADEIGDALSRPRHGHVVDRHRALR